MTQTALTISSALQTKPTTDAGPTYVPSGAQLEERRSDAHKPHYLYPLAKRLIDVAGSASLLALLSPLMVGVAVGVKLSSPGPICFRQARLTRGGRVFTLLKFRSMVDDAERSSGAVLAVKGDARVTRFGRFLRATRLDELPQLINVLQGDMSLIGPRPERPEIARELVRSIPRFNRRLETKAGLTGLAQVIQGYPDGVRGYRRKLGLDILYIQQSSLVLDAWIALKTVSVVLTGSGAR